MSIGPLSGPDAAFYRAKAQEMLKRAEQAATDEARSDFLMLAEHWHRLAQSIEQPNF